MSESLLLLLGVVAGLVLILAFLTPKIQHESKKNEAKKIVVSAKCPTCQEPFKHSTGRTSNTGPIGNGPGRTTKTRLAQPALVRIPLRGLLLGPGLLYGRRNSKIRHGERGRTTINRFSMHPMQKPLASARLGRANIHRRYVQESPVGNPTRTRLFAMQGRLLLWMRTRRNQKSNVGRKFSSVRGATADRSIKYSTFRKNTMNKFLTTALAVLLSGCATTDGLTQTASNQETTEADSISTNFSRASTTNDQTEKFSFTLPEQNLGLTIRTAAKELGANWVLMNGIEAKPFNEFPIDAMVESEIAASIAQRAKLKTSTIGSFRFFYPEEYESLVTNQARIPWPNRYTTQHAGLTFGADTPISGNPGHPGAIARNNHPGGSHRKRCPRRRNLRIERAPVRYHYRHFPVRPNPP